MTSREQIYKAALEEIGDGIYSSLAGELAQRSARAALEAAAKVGDDDCHTPRVGQIWVDPDGGEEVTIIGVDDDGPWPVQFKYQGGVIGRSEPGMSGYNLKTCLDGHRPH